ncbi:hypothetical protein RvY_06190-2 [Ramazzottius varieornatus]|uniref:Uncharacterized protein n=1 Tax=Ramazzottius varieornatus TaxID=947166 RepID=A0A1D1UY83_RAMVA|nr:hypothetical protein RvY_06190-2 [Ramazzottius varieornatus]
MTGPRFAVWLCTNAKWSGNARSSTSCWIRALDRCSFYRHIAYSSCRTIPLGCLAWSPSRRLLPRRCLVPKKKDKNQRLKPTLKHRRVCKRCPVSSKSNRRRNSSADSAYAKRKTNCQVLVPICLL